ncbi:MAG: aldo/keto reductase [Tenericutes bacterium]|nr:aldo/keto reductase [Mycoplasmatota bacterium]
MKEYQKTYKLSNGVHIPKIGFGTWQIPNGPVAYKSVSMALKNGYKHIDTALAYGNEESVGKALKDSEFSREEIFVTTKLPAEVKDYLAAEEAFLESLNNLDLDYIDLYLIHAPWPWSDMGKDCKAGNIEVYKVLEKYYKLGKIKAIGVSNFSPNDLDNIIDNCEIVPQVNQIGYFIGMDQSETIEYCKNHNIFIEAYSPLGIGYLLSNKEIEKVAKKYDVSTAQICIRYLLQKGVVALPKSNHEERIIQNAQLDFEIKHEDMNFLDTIKGDPRRWD